MSQEKKDNLQKQQEEFKKRVEQEFNKKIEELKKRDPFVYKNF